MGIESVSLLELVSDIKITLQSRYELPVWVVAEISDLNVNRSGHCYMELVEKDSLSDKIVAKSRATIWAFTFRTLKAYFETTTGESLRDGLKVLIKATVEFHEVFGFSLNIQDIDPQYTLGDLARKKAKIIKQLNDEGVLDMNKSISFPMVPQRIAVISSETAAGYGDFLNQLVNNPKGYSFTTQLFPAIMQGEKASVSIIQALELVYSKINDFDIVAIMRGGGSKSDLNCFDDYDLAYFITQFPLPILTGIGHERDDTITDIVAHAKLKTPTAVAEFLIEKVTDFENQIDEYGALVADLSNNIFEKNEYLLEKLTQQLQTQSLSLIQNNQEYLIWAKSKVINGVQLMHLKKDRQLKNFKNNIQVLAKSAIYQEIKLTEIRKQRLGRWLGNYFNRKNKHLMFLDQTAELVNPERILESGYAWVTHKGSMVKDANKLKIGDNIDIKLARGRVEADISKVTQD